MTASSTHDQTARSSARSATRTCRPPSCTSTRSGADEGVIVRRRPARRAHRQAHRPLASGQVHRGRARDPRQGLVGRLQQPHQHRALRGAPGAHLRAPVHREVFVQEGFVGADPAYRRSLRAYTETAWASVFCDNLFIRPRDGRAGRLPAQLHDHRRAQLQGGPGARRHPQRDGHPGQPDPPGDHHRGHRVRRRDQEGRLRHHELPPAGRGRAAHAQLRQRRARTAGWRSSSASRAPARRPSPRTRSGRSSATTSTAGARGRVQLRGWLLRQDDPPVAHLRAGHLLHHAPLRHDPGERRLSTRQTRELDLDSEAITENTRAAFPLHFISNSSDTGMAGHPSNVIFLTADAFGVLPPISRLSRDQAMYHFISGYTAKLAGHGGGRQGARGHVLALLRGPVHAPPPRGLRARCWARSWTGSTCRSGWSTPAGPAARTASASG